MTTTNLLKRLNEIIPTKEILSKDCRKNYIFNTPLWEKSITVIGNITSDDDIIKTAKFRRSYCVSEYRKERMKDNRSI